MNQMYVFLKSGSCHDITVGQNKQVIQELLIQGSGEKKDVFRSHL